MAIQHFDIASLAASPWKNGGGITREIACSPAGADMDSFDWRASIATIDRPGPFSAYSGVDRIIMLLEGAGVRLHSPGGGIDHRLDRPEVPFTFAGEVALDCELLGGTSIDFNVMWRRGCLRADVRVVHGNERPALAARRLLLALRGRWQVDELACGPGAGLWWDGAARPGRACSPDAGAALLVVGLEPAATEHGSNRA